MTARSVTLTADQVRDVAIGLVSTDDERRTLAARALADALLAAEVVAPTDDADADRTIAAVMDRMAPARRGRACATSCTTSHPCRGGRPGAVASTPQTG